MTTYIMLAWFIGYGPRPTTWTAEFSSKATCEAAGEKLVARLDTIVTKTGFICVLK